MIALEPSVEEELIQTQRQIDRLQLRQADLAAEFAGSKKAGTRPATPTPTTGCASTST